MPDYKPKALPSSTGGFQRPRTPPSTSKADTTLDTSDAEQLLGKVLSAQERALRSKKRGTKRTTVLSDAWEKSREQLVHSLEQVITEGAGKVAGSGNLETLSEDIASLAQQRADKIIEDFDQVTVRRLIADKDPFGDAQRRVDTLGSREVQSAYHEGMLLAAQDRGGMRKIWKAHRECCDQCRLLDGTTRDLDDVWETSFGPIRVPPAHPSCRCSVSFVSAMRAK